MSKVILVANQVTNLEYCKDCSYIGVDGGAIYLMNHHIPMDYAIGDFDSMDAVCLETLKNQSAIIHLPTHKQESDSEYALNFASQHYDELWLTGVFGGRIDHFIALYHMLCYQDIEFTMFDTQNKMTRLKQGQYTLTKQKKYLSFFALEESVVSIEGVEYPLDHQALNLQSIYTLSNELIGTSALLSIHTGSVVVIESEDNKKTII